MTCASRAHTPCRVCACAHTVSRLRVRTHRVVSATGRLDPHRSGRGQRTASRVQTLLGSRGGGVSHWTREGVFTLVTRSHFLTSASKFNIEPNSGIFDVSADNYRASPNVETPSCAASLCVSVATYANLWVVRCSTSSQSYIYAQASAVKNKPSVPQQVKNASRLRSCTSVNVASLAVTRTARSVHRASLHTSRTHIGTNASKVTRRSEARHHTHRVVMADGLNDPIWTTKVAMETARFEACTSLGPGALRDGHGSSETQSISQVLRYFRGKDHGNTLGCYATTQRTPIGFLTNGVALGVMCAASLRVQRYNEQHDRPFPRTPPLVATPRFT